MCVWGPPHLFLCALQLLLQLRRPQVRLPRLVGALPRLAGPRRQLALETLAQPVPLARLLLKRLLPTRARSRGAAEDATGDAISQ